MPRTSEQARIAEETKLRAQLESVFGSFGPIAIISVPLCQAMTGIGPVMRLAQRDYRTSPAFKLAGVCPRCGQQAWSAPIRSADEAAAMAKTFRPDSVHLSECGRSATDSPLIPWR